VHLIVAVGLKTLFFPVDPFPGVPGALYRETPGGFIVKRERMDAPLFVT
jgi:hypothetical protein